MNPTTRGNRLEDGPSTERTLVGMVSQLEDAVMALESKVFGPRLEDAIEKAPPSANRIEEIMNRIKRCEQKLLDINRGLPL